MAIADLDAAVQYAAAGLVTGAAIGLFIDVTGETLVSGSVLPTGPWGVLGRLVVTMVICGLVSAAYGFMAGKVKRLYDEGRGPFF